MTTQEREVPTRETSRGGCGERTHVAGTNGGTLPCGAMLKQPDGSEAPYLCGTCLPMRGTPRPLGVKIETSGNVYLVRDGLAVAHIMGPQSDALATAEALAGDANAAPALLAALRWIADHGDTGAGRRPAYHDMRACARAAIAAAERRSLRNPHASVARSVSPDAGQGAHEAPSASRLPGGDV